MGYSYRFPHVSQFPLIYISPNGLSLGGSGSIESPLPEHPHILCLRAIFPNLHLKSYRHSLGEILQLTGLKAMAMKVDLLAFAIGDKSEVAIRKNSCYIAKRRPLLLLHFPAHF